MKFFTSDHHFSHRLMLKIRGFESLEEMDSLMIERWNSVISPRDEVYHLGDVSLTGPLRTLHVLNSLNGRIYLIKGNHDRCVTKKKCAERFEWIKDSYILKIDKKYKFHLYHYPLRTWNSMHYGAFSLYGHCHNKLPSHGLSFDVGVDGNNYYPWSLEEVLEKMEQLKQSNQD